MTLLHEPISAVPSAADTLRHLASCFRGADQLLAPRSSGAGGRASSRAAVNRGSDGASPSLDEIPSMATGYTEVAAEQMPEPYRSLLVHSHHMTVALGAYAKTPLDLYVMEIWREGEEYARKMYLTRTHRLEPIELGIAHVDLRMLPPAARAEILRAKTPLGAVLIKHNVLRRVEPHRYLRFEPGSPWLKWYRCPPGGPFYGRLATIYCNDQPAIGLLEIVTLWEDRHPKA